MDDDSVTSGQIYVTDDALRSLLSRISGRVPTIHPADHAPMQYNEIEPEEEMDEEPEDDLEEDPEEEMEEESKEDPEEDMDADDENEVIIRIIRLTSTCSQLLFPWIFLSPPHKKLLEIQFHTGNMFP
ncbi:unnamed protein product [Lactuca saligna]|uniref:Uncharacterized protein n=1 Tax=Lactuca saligna TaxID=75948 RepID=A0AA35YDS5_LACSI|nr:unnamed protein product [Lactuca saligna]